MKKQKTARTVSLVLGLFLIAYALNQFLHFLPTGYGDMPEFARVYLDAVVTFLPALYIFEIIIGLMLLFHKWVPFIAVVLTPLSVNFLVFNFTNGDWNIISASFVAIMNLVLLFLYWEKYRPLFS